MFGSDLATIAFFMGAVGMGLGGVALLVTLEATRRGHEQLARHTEDMGKLLTSRLEKQDRQIGAVVDRLNERLGDVENAASQQKTVLIEVSSSIETRLAGHEALLDEKLQTFRDKVAKVERVQERQTRTVSNLKAAVGGVVASIAPTPADADGVPLDGSAASVTTAPMPAQPVITDVSRAEETS